MAFWNARLATSPTFHGFVVFVSNRCVCAMVKRECYCTTNVRCCRDSRPSPLHSIGGRQAPGCVNHGAKHVFDHEVQQNAPTVGVALGAILWRHIIMSLPRPCTGRPVFIEHWDPSNQKIHGLRFCGHCGALLCGGYFASVAAAHVLHSYVERPSHILAKRINVDALVLIWQRISPPRVVE